MIDGNFVLLTALTSFIYSFIYRAGSDGGCSIGETS